MKTLYFEGAGCAECGEVENCRIRTAFHSGKNEPIYLEITGFEVTKNTAKCYANYENVGIIDSCHYIIGDDDENKHSVSDTRGKSFEYTHADILYFVNSLGCSFDAVVILPHLAGYRVFKGGFNGYNYGDEFQYNKALTHHAEEIEQHFDALEKSEGKQYPNFSLWVDSERPETLHLLRHFNGYNKHWSISNVENWQETIAETTLGKYAC